MTSPKSYDGSCFCGAVQFTVTGAPVSMGYCHCNSCRHWSAAPINAFTLWQPENVRITRGEDNIGTFRKTPQSNRKWCKTCGGHVFTEHPGLALLWQILSGTGFPNQFFNDSWVVGFCRADHGRHNVELGRRASRMAPAVLGSPGP